MPTTSTKGVTEAVEHAVASLDFEQVRQQYWDQNEFVCLPQFLSQSVIEEYFLPSVQDMKPQLNRNYIPGHKKGGSVSYYTVREHAPTFVELYRSPAFVDFLSRLVGARLMLCPENDPQRQMKELQLATEPGTVVIFNGDKLWHAVMPLGESEERAVLTLEYVTNQEMGSIKRLYSNLKDAFGYFGLKALFSGEARGKGVKG